MKGRVATGYRASARQDNDRISTSAKEDDGTVQRGSNRSWARGLIRRRDAEERGQRVAFGRKGSVFASSEGLAMVSRGSRGWTCAENRRELEATIKDPSPNAAGENAD